MANSTNRTIVLPVSPASNLPFFPTFEQNSYLDFTVDVTAPLADVGDTILALSLYISPSSGYEELTASNLNVSGSKITFWLSEGISYHTYLIKLVAKTTAGRFFDWYVGLRLDQFNAAIPLVPINTLDFSSALIWTIPVIPVPSQIYTVAQNSSVFYFDGELIGNFTAFPPIVIVPSQNYTSPDNSSVFYFDGQLVGGFTPGRVPIIPSLDFSVMDNTGLRFFLGQPNSQPYIPTPPPNVGPSQNYTIVTNSSVFYFDGQLEGFAFTPL